MNYCVEEITEMIFENVREIICINRGLTDDDYPRRLPLCEWAREQICVDRFFFGEQASPYKHENMEWFINVSGGIIGDHVIGPHYYNGGLNGIARFL